MTLTKISLNYLKSAQIPQIVELDRLYLGGMWNFDGYQREIDSENSTLLALNFIDRPDSIIGYGCLWSIVEEAHITLLLVHPDYQGQGLGQLLLLSLLEDGVKRGLERATLEVKTTNEIALSLYEKFGFKIAGRRKNYYSQTGEDAFILWKSNLNHPQFKEELNLWRETINAKLALHNLIIDK